MSEVGMQYNSLSQTCCFRCFDSVCFAHVMSNIPIVQKEAPRETQMRCIMQTLSTRTNDLNVIKLILARKK